METEIYGIIPKPKIAACPKAPPVNRLNKPKNVITSVSDQFGRKTVMHFLKSKKRGEKIPQKNRKIKKKNDY